jgi:5-(carboxyamino)imidazole ribonucleotide synthase
MPLGSSKLNMPCVLYNILGNEDVMGHYTVKGLDSVLTMTDCHFHLYGKANTMPMKKLGHLTVLGQSLEAAEAKAQAAISQLKIERGRKIRREE